MNIARAGVATQSSPGAAPSARPRGRRRVLAVAGALALAVAATGGVLALRGGSPDAPPAEEAGPLFTSSLRTVTYEVTGEGPVEEIAYIVGAGNRLATVADPKLPWRKEIAVDVGHAGGTALVNAANSGIGKLTCGVSVDGVPVYQVTGQAETDVSCSTPLPAATTLSN